MRLSNYWVIAWVVFVFNTSFSLAETDRETAEIPETSLETSIPLGDISSVPSSEPTRDGMSPEVTLMHVKIQKPSKIPTVLENGRIIVSTVESYDVDAKNLSACSFTARQNIMYLLSAMGLPIPWMAQGDANDLIRFGRSNSTLASFADKELLIDSLNQRKDEHMETVFDVYRYVSHRSYAFQAHRVAIFLGDDEEWYILDTIDGAKTREPQRFTTYLANDVDDAEWLVRLPGYSLIHLVTKEEFHSSLPYLSRELQAFFHTHYFAPPHAIAGHYGNLDITT